LEHVLQCESGNADAVFKHIDVAILVKLKHLVDGFQHGFNVFVFYSTLKNENISAEDYQLCQTVWEDNDMKTMKEFLTWYNNKDVEPIGTDYN
jgi:hypothetical protein